VTIEMTRSTIVGPGSILVRTAIELAQRHDASDASDGQSWCLRCWEPWPCAPARHARDVCLAAGVTPPSARAGSGSRPRSDASTRSSVLRSIDDRLHAPSLTERGPLGSRDAVSRGPDSGEAGSRGLRSRDAGPRALGSPEGIRAREFVSGLLRAH
jgi:hypothetical protein